MSQIVLSAASSAGSAASVVPTRIVVRAAAGGADSSALIQAAIDDITALGSGIVDLPDPEYVATNLVIPSNVPIALRGAGFGVAGNKFFTRLKRTVDGSPIISATGAGSGVNQRIILELRNLDINGGGTTASPLLRIQRASHFYADNVRVNGSSGIGAWFTEMWDCQFHRFVVESCGSGTASPAVLFDSYAGFTGQGNCNTVQFTSCVWQNNAGTDIKLSGNFTDQTPAADFEFTNTKMEGKGAGTSGTPDTYPYIDLDYAASCSFVNTRITMPTGRAGVFIQQTANSGGRRANTFTNLTLDVGGTNTPARYIDHAAGTLMLANVVWPTTQPTSEYVRIGSGIAPNGFQIHGLLHNTASSYAGFITDGRTAFEEINRRTFPLAPLATTGTVTTSGGNTVWRLADGSTQGITAQIGLPRRMDTVGRVGIRFWWSCSTTGNVRWQWTALALAEGADPTAAGTTAAQTVAAHATAGRIVRSQWVGSTGFAATWGDALQINLARVGADAADTATGTVDLLAVELVYDARI
jgi:hypothetical protein